MEKDDKTGLADQWLKDLPAGSENPAFKPEEMIICEKCGRKSPPTRTNCFYCAAALPVSELHKQFLKLNLRKLEFWEKGFNVVLLKQNDSLNLQKTNALASFLGFENEDLEKILAAKKSLPLARVESRAEAEIIVEKLADSDFESRIIEDEKLKPATAPRRLRGIEFLDDKLALILFNADDVIEISFEEVSLIVIGAIFERKIQSTEGIKRKEKGKILDSSEIGTDELLIDIYLQNDEIGYRIESGGFDFSCLAEEKGWLAGENMKRLAERLKSILPNVKYDDDYLKIRGELGKVWEVEEKNNAGGVGRQSFGKFRRTNILTVSNEAQFTRYSRLQKQVL